MPQRFAAMRNVLSDRSKVEMSSTHKATIATKCGCKIESSSDKSLRSPALRLDDLSGRTCDFVSTEFKHSPELTFQNRMHLSAEPPPLASIEDCHGHHANA